jgi:hypothetical protein
MSKKLSFRGSLPEGLEEKINLKTKKGKTGYRIVKFETMPARPGVIEYETTTKIYSKVQGAGSTSIDFTESDLLAVSYIEDHDGTAYPGSRVVIFDNQIFNQNIFVGTASTTGTEATNYYIELETVELSDIESTQLTLKSLRQLASR